MTTFNRILEYLSTSFSGQMISKVDIVAMLSIVTIMVFIEFVVYRVISHRELYNKAFHITISIVPYFIASIVMALQSNFVITLGTIGALAIIRFRTAIKNPVDMVYLLWSIFIGICCGCNLYALCLFTSVFAVAVLVCINVFGNKLLYNPLIVTVNASENIENELKEEMHKISKNIRLKSINRTNNGVDLIYEISTKKKDQLYEILQSNPNIKRFSIVEFDDEDII